MSTDAKMSIAGFSNDLSLEGNITCNKRLLGKQGTPISAKDYLDLGDGNYFLITGSAILKAIHKDGWTNGSVIYLTFDDACDMNHMGAFDPNYYPFYFRSEGSISVNSQYTIPFIFDGDNSQWKCLDSSL
jgi:hypothetical protein